MVFRRPYFCFLLFPPLLASLHDTRLDSLGNCTVNITQEFDATDTQFTAASFFLRSCVDIDAKKVYPMNCVNPQKIGITTLQTISLILLSGIVQASSAPNFTDDNWITMSGLSGANGSVLATATDSSGNVYIGGNFVIASVLATNIAKWDGTNWSALGLGMDSRVDALAVTGSDLYAGGLFTTAGGATARRVAKWNGTNWSSLGSSTVGDEVRALAVSGTNLYVGGFFTGVGTNHFNYIANWNGSSWSGLGSGMSSPVYALAVSGTNLYAAGDFFQAGGNTANKTAKWDGSTWSALGSGLSDSINALAVSGTNLYAGGNGPTNIAKWDGSSWSTLGSGLGGFNPTIVWALVVSGGDVYAGGRFTAAGGNPAGYIAKWNGTSWSALGSGMGGATTRNVLALAVSGSELYAGGNFTTAGGKVSQYLARAYLIAPPGGVVDSIVESNGNATLKFYGNPVHLFDVLRTTDLTSPITWTTLTTNPLSPAADGSFTFTDTDAPPRNAYYRSVER